MVYDLLGDSNPMVVSNAVASLAEIAETSEMGQRVFQINTATLQKMLAALNECTEWGQVFILDSLALYTPTDGREAESIIERVTPRLQVTHPLGRWDPAWTPTDTPLEACPACSTPTARWCSAR